MKSAVWRTKIVEIPVHLALPFLEYAFFQSVGVFPLAQFLPFSFGVALGRLTETPFPLFLLSFLFDVLTTPVPVRCVSILLADFCVVLLEEGFSLSENGKRAVFLVLAACFYGVFEGIYSGRLYQALAVGALVMGGVLIGGERL